MKKNYLVFVIALLSAMMAINATAQTTVYVALKDALTTGWSDGNGYNGCVFAFDTADPSKVKEVVYKLDFIPSPQEGIPDEAILVKSGTAAGDKYYAMCYSEFDTENSFCTLNFATNKRTTIGAGNKTIMDMTYDETNKVLYGMGSEIDYLAGIFTSVLYSINEKTGSLKEVCRFENHQLFGLAMGGDKLYAFDIDMEDMSSLQLIDVKTKTMTKLHDLGEIRASSCTMDYNDGILYFVADKIFYTLNPETGKMTVSENKLPQAVSGLCFTKSTADGVADVPKPADTQKVRVVETWGDVMGTTMDMTKRTVTYYNADNNPIREANYGKRYDGNVWQITNYTTYTYNDEKQLIRKNSEQYGMYDGEDMAFKAVADTMKYEYENGKLVKEIDVNGGGYTTYAHDEEGNLVKEEKYNPDRYDEYEEDYYLLKSLEYSDFAAPNCPKKVKGDGVNDWNKTVCDIEYDNAFNKTSAKTYDASGKILKSAEYWTYEEGMLVLYEYKNIKKEGDEYVESEGKKFVYSLDNGNSNRIKKQVHIYLNNEWTTEQTYSITETAEYEPKSASLLEITEVPDKLNTVELAFSYPEEFARNAGGSILFDIYRHGMPIARINPMEAEVDDDGMIIYRDENVKNGRYDYFVQTLVMTDDSIEAWNVSNIIKQELYVELPAVTNVHYVSHEEDRGTINVTIGWDAPANIDERLGFLGYNIFKNKNQAPQNDDKQQETTYTLLLNDFGETVTVEAVYNLGKVKTGPVVISKPDAIENNPLSELIRINDGQIFIHNENASVEIISLGGAVLSRYQNVKTIELNTLEAGMYLVRTVCDGDVYITKLIIK